jgi:hypothetical protein
MRTARIRGHEDAGAGSGRRKNERWLSFRSEIPKGRALTVSYEQLCDGATAEPGDFVGLSTGEALRKYRRQDPEAETLECSEAALHVWERPGRP